MVIFMNSFINPKEYFLVDTDFSTEQPTFFSQASRRKDEQMSAIGDSESPENTVVFKQLFYWRVIFLQLFVVSLLISFAEFARADQSDYLADRSQSQWLQLASLDDEKRPLFIADAKRATTSWALAFDNDLLAPGHRDRDYTYGVNLTYSGESAVDADISLKTPLAVIDDALGVDSWVAKPRHNYSLEAGLFGFTPKELERSDIDKTDRPYAGLVYFSSSHEQIDMENNIAWNTTLTLGVLGLSVVGDLQNTAHQETSGVNARGWNHQISDGGELTARYVIARQDYLESFSDSVELKSTVQASAGYLTETSWGLSLRAGRIISPWASFNPDLISYGEKSTYSNNTSTTNEHYFWTGFTLKARFYNAFLQGQFRDSDFSYSYSGLRPLIAEAWAGYTYAFKQGYRVSYVLRAQSSEIKRGDGNRSVVWGGLIFAKTI
jgi:hypothetical protein